MSNNEFMIGWIMWIVFPLHPHTNSDRLDYELLCCVPSDLDLFLRWKGNQKHKTRKNKEIIVQSKCEQSQKREKDNL